MFLKVCSIRIPDPITLSLRGAFISINSILSNNCFTGQIESNYDETTDSFDAMNLKPDLLRGVYAYGFERPSAIQQRAIMPVIKGACYS